MFAAAAASASHPVVAAVLALGAAGVAGGIVAMAWNVHVRQFRLAELLARRQFAVRDAGHEAAGATATGTERVNGTGVVPPVVIEGPETVVTGEQARYRVRPAGSRKVVSWAVGGGAVTQAPDPAQPEGLLLIADRPGSLTVSVRVRDGMTERRGTKTVSVLADLTTGPPVTLRVFLNGWGLAAVAVLIAGFAAALDALGSLSSPDFIALVAPLAAVLGVVAAVRAAPGTPDRPQHATASSPAPGEWPAVSPVPGSPRPGEAPVHDDPPG